MAVEGIWRADFSVLVLGRKGQLLMLGEGRGELYSFVHVFFYWLKFSVDSVDDPLALHYLIIWHPLLSAPVLA